MPISAADTITLAAEHTKRQLAQPFRFGQWTRLAAVGLLAGEMGSGGCNLPHHIPQGTGPGGLPSIDPMLLGGLITMLLVSGLVLAVIMMYINSVMRFILFDSVLTRECYIRQGWVRRQGPGLRFFLWQVGFALVVLAGLAVLVGIPAGLAFALGWFRQPREHVPGFVLGGICIFLLLAAFFILTAVIHVLTKDFVIPQMALEGIGPIDGWKRLLPMLQAEVGGYAGYVAMKIVLAIAVAILIGIASLIVGLLAAIPTVGLAIVAIITGKSAGLTWNSYTITVAVVVGCILLAIFLYLMALVAVPAIVFFPAYSIYFFASRYRPLSLILYPPPAPPPLGPPSIASESAG